MVILVVTAVILIIVEIIIFIARGRGEKKREKETLASLKKFVEYEVLNLTLENPITNEQAADYEFQRAFLRIEFPDSKPWFAYLFNLDECITIGRSRENKIAIRDDKMSRTHCKIYVVNGYMWLQDLGTANGTVVQKSFFKRIYLTSQETAPLENGDIIKVGSYRMRVKIYYGYQAAM